MNYTIICLMLSSCFLFGIGEAKETSEGFEKTSFFQMKTISDTSIEDLILSKIHNLYEVKRKEKYIDSITNHKHGISLLILKKPSAKKQYYIVQAGYDSKIRFEPYYTFYVFRNALEVKYYDTQTDSLMSIDEWRKRSKQLSH